jgi:pimeloyl-ACP methyl ester carboxylesterase
MLIREFDLALPDGRTLHAYDAGPAASRLVVVWHHGTPNIGSPPEPLSADAHRLGIRWLSYDRAGYGGSSPHPVRDVASAAGDVAAIADAAGVDRFATMGHSGGAMHALACGALLSKRVVAVVGVSTLAPYSAVGLDWFDGMAAPGIAALRAAAEGREAKERYEASAIDDGSGFTAADHAALAAEWSWFGSVVAPALRNGPGGLIDDDMAYVAPWGFDAAEVRPRVLLIHGDEDRIAPVAHARWLVHRLPAAELRVIPGAGHVSVLSEGRAALEWLAARAASVGGAGGP